MAFLHIELLNHNFWQCIYQDPHILPLDSFQTLCHRQFWEFLVLTRNMINLITEFAVAALIVDFNMRCALEIFSLLGFDSLPLISKWMTWNTTLLLDFYFYFYFWRTHKLNGPWLTFTRSARIFSLVSPRVHEIIVVARSLEKKEDQSFGTPLNAGNFLENNCLTRICDLVRLISFDSFCVLFKKLSRFVVEFSRLAS